MNPPIIQDRWIHFCIKGQGRWQDRVLSILSSKLRFLINIEII